MNDEENVALVIKTGIEQTLAPLQRLLEKLIGPAATEVGLALEDSVKVWRSKRQARLFQVSKGFMEDSGKDIGPIATRLFFPILEAASIEDSDSMQTRWAALLANEATSAGSVHPSYIDILRQLTPTDAVLLDNLCDYSERKKSLKLVSTFYDRELKVILEGREESLENLVRQGLVTSEYEIDNTHRGDRIPEELNSWYELSSFAVRFVSACRAPICSKHRDCEAEG